MNESLLSAFDIAIKTSLVVVVTSIVVRALGKRSASARHVVWLCGIAVLFAIPALSLRHTGLTVTLEATPSPIRRPVKQATTSIAQGPSQGEITIPASRVTTVPVVTSTLVPVASAAHRTMTTSKDPVPMRSLEIDWISSIASLWGLIAAALLGLQCVGVAQALRWRRSAHPFADQGLADRYRAQAGLSRSVDVLVFGQTRPSTPMTWGTRRPVVLLPAEATNWPEPLLASVLLHEFAHVRRRDVASQAVAWLAVSLFWFNPLVWWAAAQMRMEAEGACDDFVIRCGTLPTTYANDLLKIAMAAKGRRQIFPFHGVSAMNPTNLERRIADILDGRRTRTGATALGVVGAVAAAGAVVGSLGLWHIGNTPARIQADSQVKDTTIWRLTLHDGDETRMYFAYRIPKGVSVWINRDTAHGRSRSGSTCDESWLGSEKDPEAVGIAEAQKPLEPCRLVQPEYRALIESRGGKVEPITVAELRKFVHLNTPPDLDLERQQFIDTQVQAGKGRASDCQGATVTFRGRLVDVLKRPADISEMLPSDTTTEASGDRIWCISGGTFIWLLKESGVETFFAQIFVNQTPVRDGQNGQDKIENIALQSSPFIPFPNGKLTANGEELQMSRFDDPAYRAELAKKSIRFAIVTQQEADDLIAVKVGPKLESLLADAQARFKYTQLHPDVTKLQAPQVPASTTTNTIHGTIEARGQTNNIYVVGADYDALQRPFQREELDEALSDGEFKLGELAEKQAANESSQEGASRAGSSAAHAAIRQEVHEIVGAMESHGFCAPTQEAKNYRASVLERLNVETSISNTFTLIFTHQTLHDELLNAAKQADRLLDEPAAISYQHQIVNLSVKDEKVREVLNRMLGPKGIKIVIDRKIQGKVSLVAKNTPANMILMEICKQVNADWRVVDLVYIFSPKRSRPTAESTGQVQPTP